jgi:hypothetical protein
VSQPDGSAARRERRINQRRRQDRWGRRIRPIVTGFVFDGIVIAAIAVIQPRTKAGISVLSRRLKGEQAAAFPRPRFLGDGNIEDFERFASELEELRRDATTDPVTGLPNKVTLQPICCSTQRWQPGIAAC